MSQQTDTSQPGGLHSERRSRRKDLVTAMFPLTPTQEGMLFHGLAHPEDPVYFQQRCFSFAGELDPIALEQAWQKVIDRHDSLRSRIVWDRGPKPFQVIFRKLRIPMRMLDFSTQTPAERQRSLEDFFRDDEAEGFDLRRPPLTRLTLIRLADERWELVWSCHHIQLDAWSMVVIFDEVCALYEAYRKGQELTLPPAPAFQSYVRWLETKNRSEDDAYWRTTLSSVDVPTPLPFDRLGVSEREASGEATVTLPEELAIGLVAMARRCRVTQNVLIQAAWGLLLSRLSGCREVVFGVTLSGRSPELPDVESMVGLLIGTLPLRLSTQPQSLLEDWLEQVQTRVNELQDYQHCSATEIREAAGIAAERTMFESVVVFQNLPEAEAADGAALGAEVLNAYQPREKRESPLCLEATPSASDIDFHLGFHQPRFESVDAERILQHLGVILRGFLTSPKATLSALPLLSESQKSQLLLAGNSASVASPAGCFHQLFVDTVQAHRQSPAVASDERTLTYEELEHGANRLAHLLIARGVGPEEPVAILLERSVEALVAMLAVIKAGGAYVPMEPSNPAERLATLMQEAHIRHGISRSQTLRSAALVRAHFLLLDQEQDALQQLPVTAPAVVIHPEHLMYLLFTSGTTGAPKAVAIEHRQAVAYAEAVRERLDLEGPCSFANVSSLAADLGNTGIFGAWLTGGCLHVLSTAQVADPEATAEYLARHEIDALKIVPSHFAVLRSLPEPQRVVPRQRLILGGEASRWQDVREIQALTPDCRVFNHYGPTETTVGVLAFDATTDTADADGALPLGSPLRHATAHVLDATMSLLPAGVAGELWIGGQGVARGYHGMSAQTAERFRPDPFSGQRGTRLYRTGDRAIRQSDGELSFLGRVDHQVKVRGFRVELEEVASVLQAHPAVDQAVALPLADDDGRVDELVGFAVPGRRHGATIDERPRVELSNGMWIVESNERETDYLYHDIFEQRAYLRHGVRLPADPCVLDIGANIGMFSLLVASLRPAARILAFEPIAPVHQALALNAELYAPAVETFACGLAAQEGEAEFVHYPEYSVMSGLAEYANADAELDVLRRYLAAQGEGTDDAQGEGADDAQAAAELDQVLAERLQGEAYTCRLRRLSEVLHTEGIERVDLLKVDVQRAELDVLRGLDKDDWSRIDQVVVEVHDVRPDGVDRGRVEELQGLLEGLGFEVVCEQEEVLRGSDLFTLYAVRPQRRPAGEEVPSLPPVGVVGEEHLRADLAQKLPPYAVPSRIILLSELPLTANGKVDLSRLAELARDTADASAAAASDGELTPLEQDLLEIWREVLETPDVDPRTSFFDQGGHSLLVMKMLVRLRHTMDVQVPLRRFLDNPTISGLALTVVELQASQLDEAAVAELLASMETAAD